MFNINHIVQHGGLPLIALLIFAESGMFVGFFFPGDTLLITAGIFAATGQLNLFSLIVVVALAAILGDNTGYLIGDKFGRRLFARENSVIFNKEHIEKTEAFFAKYGSKTMLIAHFIPVIRTFAPAIAGVGEMKHKNFFIFDAIGDVAWAIAVTLIGYFFGRKIPNIDHYILIVVAVVIVATIAPTIRQIVKNSKQKKSASSSKIKAKTKSKEKEKA